MLKSLKGLPCEKITEIQKKLRERLAKPSLPPKKNEAAFSPVENPTIYWNKQLSFGERLQGLKNKPIVRSSWDKEREERKTKLKQTQEEEEERLRRMDPMMPLEERTLRASESAYHGKECNLNDDSSTPSTTNDRKNVDESLRQEDKKKVASAAAQATFKRKRKSRPGFEGPPSTKQKLSNETSKRIRKNQKRISSSSKVKPPPPPP
ncbi:771_t:CDS:2 [Ambispora leptoticha]|uniref:771_t:CDS:1 n=1 Tax=Ambispora leptoticha TaxID=144679 RepID=A0A9N9BFL2_9GLOM|nr:771_t:CDS:2 [Ambispora leptoticha]